MGLPTDSEFSKNRVGMCSCCVVYLGHVLGQGHVKPVDVKVSAVVKFPKPTRIDALF